MWYVPVSSLDLKLLRPATRWYVALVSRCHSLSETWWGLVELGKETEKCCHFGRRDQNNWSILRLYGQTFHTPDMWDKSFQRLSWRGTLSFIRIIPLGTMSGTSRTLAMSPVGVFPRGYIGWRVFQIERVMLVVQTLFMRKGMSIKLFKTHRINVDGEKCHKRVII